MKKKRSRNIEEKRGERYIAQELSPFELLYDNLNDYNLVRFFFFFLSKRKSTTIPN